MLINFRFFIGVACFLLVFFPHVSADSYPPEWGGGAVDEINGPIHFSPAPWPEEAAPLVDCLFNCGGWKPYSRFQNHIADPRTQDPSNGGTRPQNYVNIASSCIDKEAPSIYYNLYKSPNCATDAAQCDDDVLMFRWRVEQIANTYATGPNTGSYGSTDPWNSALWTVLFDVDGDGYRDLAAHLDGSSGSPSAPIDRIAGIWGNIPTQSIDYINDPSINIIAHNPTGFIAADGSTVLNFQDSLTLSDEWSNGSDETVWDYGTSRAKKVYTNSCTEYFVDYQIPIRMLNASSSGPNATLDGPKITRSTPLSMLFCTANSLNNPFQKDCAINKSWIADPNKEAPFGDYLSFAKDDPYSQPIISSVTADAPLSCPGSYSLEAKVQDALAVIDGEVTHSIREVRFVYWYDKNGDGFADSNDSGSEWTFLGSSNAPEPGSLNTWKFDWDASNLLKGRYLIGVQAIDDKTLHDDGAPDAPVDNRTFSYIVGDDSSGTENYIYNNGWVWDGASKNWVLSNPAGWVGSEEAAFPDNNENLTPGSTEDWYGNPNITGVQIAQLGIDLAINACGVAPTIVKSADETNLMIGEIVTFTLTISNPANNPSSITLTEFKDIIPNGFTYINATTSGIFGVANPTINGQILTWLGSTVVNAGSSVSLSFSATAPNEAGSYSNDSSAITSFGEIYSNTVELGVGSPRLTISKLASSLSLNEGDPVTYTITYSNDSPITANNVVITDQIQDGLTYVSCTDNCACSGDCGVGDTITWTIGSLDPGLSPATVSFAAFVTDPYPNSAAVPLVNTAIIDSAETLPTNASASSYVNIPRPELSLTKVSNVSLVDPGADVIFTLNYNNSGLAAATGVTLTDIIPSGFTFQSCFTDCTNPGVGNNGTVSWNIETLNASTSGSVTLTIRANDPFDGTDNPIVNTATLSSNETNPVNDTASVGIKQVGQVCNKQYLRSEAKYIGDDGTRRISNAIVPTGAATIISVLADDNSNAGEIEIARFYQDPISSRQVVFDGTSTLSGQLDYIKSNLLGGSANANSDLIVKIYDYDPATGDKVLIATVSQTDNGAPTPPVTLVGVTASNSLEKGHRFLTIMYADMQLSKVTTIELRADSVDSFVEICSNPPVNLTLEKAVDQSSVAITGTGRTLTYTLKYSNTSSTADAAGVVLTDIIPTIAGVTFNSCSVVGSTHFAGCSESAGVVTFHDGSSNPVNLIAGGSGEVNVVINIPDDLTGSSTIDNSSSILSTQTDLITSTASTLIEGSGQSGTPNITLSKKVDDSSAVTGQIITYTLTVLNAGASDATNVVVTDDFPENTYYTYGACATAKGSCTETPAGILSWNVGALNAGSSAILTFTMIVGTNPPPGLTEIINNASAVDDSYCTGAIPASCSSEDVIVTISTNPNLTISKTVLPAGPYLAGDTLTYSMVVNNTGSGDADNVKITDPILGYISYLGGSLKIDGAIKTDQNGDDTAYFDAIANQTVFEVGNLAAGDTTTLTFKVSISDRLPNGSTDIDNTATVSSSNAASRESSITVSATSSPSLSIFKTGSSSHPFPASRLSSNVTAGSTSISVTDSSQLSVGQYLKIANDFIKITAINGNVITLNSGLTVDAVADDPLLSSLTYSMVYQNTGTSSASAVVITDTLPASFLYIDSSATAETHPSVGDSGNVVWNIGDVNPNSNGMVQLTVIPTAIGSKTNAVTLTDATYCESSPAACNDEQQTNIGGLSVTKSTSTPLVSASASVPLNTASYILVIENTTNSDINNVEVSDVLSKGFTYKLGTTKIDGLAADDPTFESDATSLPTWIINTLANTSVEIRFESEVGIQVGAATYQNEVKLKTARSDIGITKFDYLSTTQEDVTILPTDKGIIEGYVFKDDGSAQGSLDGNDLRYVNVPVTLSRNGETCWPLTLANAYSGDCYIAYSDSLGYFSIVAPLGTWAVDVIEGEGDLSNSINQVIGTDTTDITVLSQTIHQDLNGYGLYDVAAAAVTRTSGVIYAGTGDTISGGFVSVACSPEQNIIYEKDGSGGQYQWYVDGLAETTTCNMILTLPAGYALDETCLASNNTLDPIGQNDPFIVGSSLDNATNRLIDASCAANTWYTSFNLEPGTPSIFNNNLPIKKYAAVVAVPMLNLYSLILLILCMLGVVAYRGYLRGRPS